jgi:hypothetical protein
VFEGSRTGTELSPRILASKALLREFKRADTLSIWVESEFNSRPESMPSSNKEVTTA